MIDPSARVHASADLEADVTVGSGTSIWHRAQIRTGARIGRDCVIGRDVFIDEGVSLGDRVKVQNGALVYHGVTVSDAVFIGPGAILTNDRHPRAVDRRPVASPATRTGPSARSSSPRVRPSAPARSSSPAATSAVRDGRRGRGRHPRSPGARRRRRQPGARHRLGLRLRPAPHRFHRPSGPRHPRALRPRPRAQLPGLRAPVRVLGEEGILHERQGPAVAQGARP